MKKQLFLIALLIWILSGVIIVISGSKTVKVFVAGHVYSSRRAFTSESQRKNLADARADSAMLASKDSVYIVYTCVPMNGCVEKISLNKPDNLTQNQCINKIKSVPVIE